LAFFDAGVACVVWRGFRVFDEGVNAVTFSVVKKAPAVRFLSDGRMDFLTRDERVISIIRRGRDDLAFFAKTFLSGSFYEKMTSQRSEVCRLFDDRGLPMVAVMAWRGFGKSTLFNAAIIREVCYRVSRFPLYVAAGFDLAVQQTEDIKAELMTNDLLRDAFGSFKQTSVSVDDMKFGFSKKGYFLVDPLTEEPFAFVMPKGAGQKVRGLNVRIGGVKCRPDFVGVDDLEDDEEVWNDQSRRKLWMWFNGALKHVVPKQRPTGRGDERGR